jgi:hypothetical protein
VADHRLLANGPVVLGLTASLRASACADQLEYVGQMKFYGLTARVLRNWRLKSSFRAYQTKERIIEPVPFKYRAFLSYSHRDKAWGKWLHAALEGHRVDKDLVGRDTPAGPVPKTLRPIFRDREDFSAGHSLTAQTIAALEASNFALRSCCTRSVSAPATRVPSDEVTSTGSDEFPCRVNEIG